MTVPEGSEVGRSRLSSEDAGRACPHCHQPLTEDRALALCGECGAAHHADCWRANGGCAAAACSDREVPATAASGLSGAAPTEPVFPEQAVGGTPSTAPMGSHLPPSLPPTRGEWRTPSLALAIAVLLIAVAGAGVAIALAVAGGKSRRVAFTTQLPGVPEGVVTTAPADGGTETTPAETSPGSETSAGNETSTGGEGSLPSVSTAQMESEIQHMLLEWHEDVVQGNYRAAWGLLSHRKQEQANGEYGYSSWVKNQETLRPYLNPAGLKASIQSTEAGEGVARVDVTGMTWSKPGASCKEWSGVTWVKYEEGAWRYDPGYSTTPQREHEWKSRFSELLGGRC